MTSRGYPLAPTDTARRLHWAHLPPTVRHAVEEHCGAPVLGAESRDGGFTPGVASVLTCADGSQHFLKAASAKGQRAIAGAYAEEGRRWSQLPSGLPVPALRWSDTVDDWVVLLAEHVDADPPTRPWPVDALNACLDALAAVATTPVPAPMDLPTFADETSSWPAAWDGLQVPTHPARHAEAAALAQSCAEHSRGDALVHTDPAADNWLMAPDGAPLLTDWKWPVRGAAWIDSYLLLAAAHGDGVDVAPLIAARPTLAAVADEAVDSLLALVAGYFLRAGCGPVPPSSPNVRDHQSWTGTVCWLWLAERRGW